MYQVHQASAHDGTCVGETELRHAAPDARKVTPDGSKARTAVVVAQLRDNQQQQHHKSVVPAKRAAAAPTKTESPKRMREREVGQGRGAAVLLIAAKAGARENQPQRW